MAMRESCSIPSRILSAIIDYSVVFVLLFAGSGAVSALFGVNSPALPFVVMELIFARANGDAVFVFTMWTAFVCLEISYFTISEALFKGCTIGRKAANARLAPENGGKLSLLQILERNFLKALSRFLFCAPTLASLLLKKKFFYDWMTHSLVFQDTMRS
jgi:uncharacterized RDD family membrane protein YckC